jgi:hypothetical protein
VRDIAETWWRLERAKRIETALLQAHAGSDDDLAGYLSSDRSGQYERVARHIDRLQRAWHRAIDTLRRTQNERRRAEQHDAIQRVHEATADCQRNMAESYHEIRLARQEHRSEHARKEAIGFVPSPAPATSRPSRVPALTGLEPAEWRL